MHKRQPFRSAWVAARAVLEFFGKTKIRSLLFDAPFEFHFEHMRSLVQAAIDNPSFHVTLVKWRDFSPNTVHGLHGKFDFVEREKLEAQLAYQYDLFLTTEFSSNLWWFEGMMKTALLAHGVGPKASYIKNPRLSAFDYILSPGPTTKRLQMEVVSDASKYIDAGLLLSDRILQQKEQPQTDNFDTSRPYTIIYAPSWSAEPHLIPLNEEMLQFLEQQTLANVYIRPHPLLMLPERCGGIDWGVRLNQMTATHIKLHNAPRSSIYDILARGDLMITDISSVLYEFMLLDRPVVIYDPTDMFANYGAEGERADLQNAVHITSSSTELEHLLPTLLTKPDASSAGRQRVLDLTFFNRGHVCEKLAPKLALLCDGTLANE